MYSLQQRHLITKHNLFCVNTKALAKLFYIKAITLSNRVTNVVCYDCCLNQVCFHYNCYIIYIYEKTKKKGGFRNSFRIYFSMSWCLKGWGTEDNYLAFGLWSVLLFFHCLRFDQL